MGCRRWLRRPCESSRGRTTATGTARGQAWSPQGKCARAFTLPAARCAGGGSVELLRHDSDVACATWGCPRVLAERLPLRLTRATCGDGAAGWRAGSVGRDRAALHCAAEQGSAAVSPRAPHGTLRPFRTPCIHRYRCASLTLSSITSFPVRGHRPRHAILPGQADGGPPPDRRGFSPSRNHGRPTGVEARACARVGRRTGPRCAVSPETCCR